MTASAHRLACLAMSTTLVLALAACRPPNAPKEPTEPNEPTDPTIGATDAGDGGGGSPSLRNARDTQLALR